MGGHIDIHTLIPPHQASLHAEGGSFRRGWVVGITGLRNMRGGRNGLTDHGNLTVSSPSQDTAEKELL